MTVEAAPVAEIDPFLDVFTENEERMAAMIRGQGQRAVTLKQVGIAIGAAYVLYRLWMWRRLKEEMLNAKLNPSPENLYELNSRIFGEGWGAIAWTVVPALVSGYSVGLQDVVQQNYSRAWMQRAAEDYAISLMENLHDTSTEALMEGYRAQLNRNLANRKAVDNVIDAFGVTPRTMRTLVNLWAAPADEIKTTREIKPKAKVRADRLISEAIASRAEAIGQTESYAAKNNAKSIVWLYLQQEGQLPKTATKMWITADDEKTCPICAPLHHSQVLLNEKFSTAQGDVWAPSLHPNCRCDIVLRGIVEIHDTGEYLEEFAPRELAIAKSAWGVVSKAKGSDPVDRDKKGRFAAVESRGGRVQVRRTGVVRGQLDQARAEQIAAENSKAKQEARQKATLLTDEERAAIAASYQQVEEKLAGTQKLSLTGKLALSQNLSLSTPQDKLSLTTEESEQKLALSQDQKLSLTAGKLSLMDQKLKLTQDIKLSMPTEAALRLSAPQTIDPSVPDEFENHPSSGFLYGLFTGHEEAIHYGGDDDNSRVMADKDIPWFTNQNDLSLAIGEHWDQELDKVGDQLFFNHPLYDGDMDAILLPIGGPSNQSVVIWRDDLYEVLASSLPGEERNGLRGFEVYDPDSGRVMSTQDTELSMHELKHGLGTEKFMRRFVEEHQPMIGVTTFYNVRQSSTHSSGEAITNPGIWQIKYPFSGARTVPYTMVFMDPHDALNEDALGRNLFGRDEDEDDDDDILDIWAEETNSPFD